MHDRFKLITLILLITGCFTANAQKQLNSPYARFNLGAPETQGSYKSRGMGGIGVAMRDNNSIFYINPASYSSLDTNSFTFDFGFDFGASALIDGDNRYTSNDMNFNHLFMGFPIAKGWGIATGLIPVSNGYYKISEVSKEGDAGYDPLTGPYTAYHRGSGGLNNFFAGTGININKNFSAGANMSLLFGILDRTYTLQFDDLEDYFHNSSSEKLQIKGVNFDIGLQYRATIKEDYFLNAGISMAAGRDYASKYNFLAVRTSAFNAVDTISYTSDGSALVRLPATYRTGIAFGKKNKFTTGFDYISTAWSKASLPGSDGYAANTSTLAWGLEYIPDKYSNFSLLRRLEYRAGAHIGSNYLIINGEQLKEIGASLGLGIPMRRTMSRANLFVDFTRKSGSEAAGLHTEYYITIGGSLNIYDFWFLQRKYN